MIGLLASRRPCPTQSLTSIAAIGIARRDGVDTGATPRRPGLSGVGWTRLDNAAERVLKRGIKKRGIKTLLDHDLLSLL